MNKYVTYWIDSANHDLDVAESLFITAKYDWCLFVGHLVIPRTHDLVRLAQMAGVDVDENTNEFLDMVNTFNISTRYPDEKFKFYEMCTKEFTEAHLLRIKEIRRWLLQKIYP